MRLKKIIQMFEKGNVCVCGLKGSGKDMLFANVTNRRNIPYVCNTEYEPRKLTTKNRKLQFNKLELEKLNCGENDYRNFLNGDIKYYEYPYEDGTDIYISDAGVYFPSQYCNELNRDFKYFPTFMALSRHLGEANVHFNAQNLNRVWDKIREQSDQYIMMRWSICIPLIRLVIQKVRIYEKYQSAVDRVPPFRINIPLVGSGKTRYEVRMRKQEFACAYGEIKSGILVYRNKSKYNTRIFKEILANGAK
jgi:hypothetical protein